LEIEAVVADADYGTTTAFRTTPASGRRRVRRLDGLHHAQARSKPSRRCSLEVGVGPDQLMIIG